MRRFTAKRNVTLVDPRCRARSGGHHITAHLWFCNQDSLGAVTEHRAGFIGSGIPICPGTAPKARGAMLNACLGGPKSLCVLLTSSKLDVPFSLVLSLCVVSLEHFSSKDQDALQGWTC